MLAPMPMSSAGAFGKAYTILCMTVALAWPTYSTQLSEDVFPMTKGTYWIYRGEVTWQDNNETKSAKVEWKMEVVECISRKDGGAAVLKGHPEDLRGYSPGRERLDHLLVRIGKTKWYLVDGPDFASAMRSFQNPEQLLSELVDESQLILQSPLKTDMVFGEPDQLKREDRMYIWHIENESRVRLAGVAGAPRGKQTEYSIAFLTNPEHTYISFVPGIGVTKYIYGHHGTVSSVSVRLMKFRPR